MLVVDSMSALGMTFSNGAPATDGAARWARVGAWRREAGARCALSKLGRGLGSAGYGVSQML